MRDEDSGASERKTAPMAQTDGNAPANIRAVLRVGNEFFLRGLDMLARLLGDDLIKALVYNAMWTANVLHITNSAANSEYGGMEDIPPDALRKPVSVLALANSLRIPYETVRRSVQALLQAGLCIRVERKGLIVPAAIHARQASRDVMHHGLPSLLLFLADLQRAGFDFEPYRRKLATTVALPTDGSLPPNARALLRVCSELIMRGIDTMGKVHGDDFLAALIFSAIWTANVRHITGSTGNLDYGGLHDLPPDALRRPVTVLAVATALRMPYETVRRCTTKLLRAGSVVRIEGKGLIVPKERLTVSAAYDGVRTSYSHVVRTIADLHRAGFDFSEY